MKTTKTFKQICQQCERIISLHLNGYGTEKMYQFTEQTFFKAMQLNGGY